MEEGSEKERCDDLPVKGAADAVGVARPDDAVAIGVKEGTMLFEHL